jgi:DNA invertase Pin-like site-specific DNA recombinase
MGRAKKKVIAPADTVVAYTRVSTGDQADSGLGLDAQTTAITAEVDRRGWRIVEAHSDAASGKSTVGRPGLDAALAAVREGRTAALMVSKLDRLSRSVLDFATVAALAQKEGWRLVVVDLGLDLGTANGQLTATLLSGVAEWERSIIGARTREALAAARASGTRLGRPRVLSDMVLRRIIGERAAGRTFAEIARRLEADGVSTARGGDRWYPSTVAAVLGSRGARDLAPTP